MHKWQVFVQCCKFGVPLLGLTHDLHKFLPNIFVAYARNNTTGVADVDYKLAWLHHNHHSKHHWEYWVLLEDFGGLTTYPMPAKYAKEMVADWMSAAGMRGTDAKAWYAKNRDSILLHVDTRDLVEHVLGYV